MIRDGNPSPAQAKRMVKVFVIATLLGGLMVFVSVTMRSYNIRQQQAYLKSQEAVSGSTKPAAPAAIPGTATPAPEAAPTTP
ncbi:MAG: hypothetical protein M3Q07_22545 [Pseudobdellovibrionaceae bacterium]|nr:hypothetical protein [Pseudobdellovibrionaceae bacterium]